MGISGLLPLLRPITERVHVRKWAGKRVAVDASCYLHKGAYTCSKEMCLGIPSKKYINYCLDRVRILQQAGVKPVVVFDGQPLPAKKDENSSRRQDRADNLERALQHLDSGNLSAAQNCFQRSVNIRPEHAKHLIEALKPLGVPFIVAPYEADAQMAFLALNGHVDAVITEDSDLLAYGCECVLFKFEKDGFVDEIRRERFPQNTTVSFIGFSPQMILEMCILAGCDFLPSLKGIGPKKAHSLLKRFRHFMRAVKHLRYDGTTVARDYEQRFQRAILIFKHQRVWDPVKKELRHLHEVPADGIRVALEKSQTSCTVEVFDPSKVDLDFLGPSVAHHVAEGIAVGDLHPGTLKPYEGDHTRMPCQLPPDIQHLAQKYIRKAADTSGSGHRPPPARQSAPPGGAAGASVGAVEPAFHAASGVRRGVRQGLQRAVSGFQAFALGAKRPAPAAGQVDGGGFRTVSGKAAPKRSKPGGSVSRFFEKQVLPQRSRSAEPSTSNPASGRSGSLDIEIDSPTKMMAKISRVGEPGPAAGRGREPMAEIQSPPRAAPSASTGKSPFLHLQELSQYRRNADEALGKAFALARGRGRPTLDEPDALRARRAQAETAAQDASVLMASAGARKCLQPFVRPKAIKKCNETGPGKSPFTSFAYRGKRQR